MKDKKIRGKNRVATQAARPKLHLHFPLMFLNITFTAFNYFFFQQDFSTCFFSLKKIIFLAVTDLRGLVKIFFLSGSEPVIALCHAHIYKETRTRADTYTAVFAHALCTMQHIITCCYSDGLGACQPAVGSNTSSGYTVLPRNTGSHTQSR